MLSTRAWHARSATGAAGGVRAPRAWGQAAGVAMVPGYASSRRQHKGEWARTGWGRAMVQERTRRADPIRHGTPPGCRPRQTGTQRGRQLEGGTQEEDIVDRSLQNNTALVTDGRAGIGKGITRGLTQEGGHAAIGARCPALLEATAEAIRQATGWQILALPADPPTLADAEPGIPTAARWAAQEAFRMENATTSLPYNRSRLCTALVAIVLCRRCCKRSGFTRCAARALARSL